MESRLPGRRVLLVTTANRVQILAETGAADGGNVAGTSTTSGGDGKFQFTPTAAPRGVVVVSPQGIGWAGAAGLAQGGTIIVRRGGVSRGRPDRIAAGSAVERRDVERGERRAAFRVQVRRPIVADLNGRFVFDHVPPGPIRIAFHRGRGVSRALLLLRGERGCDGTVSWAERGGRWWGG